MCWSSAYTNIVLGFSYKRINCDTLNSYYAIDDVWNKLIRNIHVTLSTKCIRYNTRVEVVLYFGSLEKKSYTPFRETHQNTHTE